MARVQRTSKGKTMKPNYFVFCEGETEVAYVEMLRAHYRLPIHIIPKRTLLNVTPALISRCKANIKPTLIYLEIRLFFFRTFRTQCIRNWN